MMTQLLKVHGSQNSFFILDQTKLKQALTDDELRRLARQLTDPQDGLLGGADGLLVVGRPTRPGATAHVRQWPPDRRTLRGGAGRPDVVQSRHNGQQFASPASRRTGARRPCLCRGNLTGPL